jgi:hypothetical protein
MIAYCGCTSAPFAKNGGDKGSKLEMPYHTRTRGAEFQDARYGKGNRVFNAGKDKKWRCTICLGLK